MGEALLFLLLISSSIMATEKLPLLQTDEDKVIIKYENDKCPGHLCSCSVSKC